jgi:hypothetical protein
MASFAQATAETATAGVSIAAEGIVEAAYTAGEKVGQTVSDTVVVKTAASAARSAAELEAVKQAKRVGTGMAGTGKKTGAKLKQAGNSKTRRTPDDVVHLAHSPNADQARKEKMQRVRVWLEQARLGLYADRFESEGYDDLEALRDLHDMEVEELIEEVEMKKGHARNFRKRIAELQAAVDFDQHGKALVQDKPSDFSSKFIPYDRLPMPVGRDTDLSFQLGVSIGRVKAPDALKASADMLQSETIEEVHEGTRKRLRSPPKKRQASPTSSSPATPGSARGTNQ